MSTIASAVSGSAPAFRAASPAACCAFSRGVAGGWSAAVASAADGFGCDASAIATGPSFGGAPAAGASSDLGGVGDEDPVRDEAPGGVHCGCGGPAGVCGGGATGSGRGPSRSRSIRSTSTCPAAALIEPSNFTSGLPSSPPTPSEICLPASAATSGRSCGRSAGIGSVSLMSSERSSSPTDPSDCTSSRCPGFLRGIPNSSPLCHMRRSTIRKLILDSSAIRIVGGGGSFIGND